MAKLKSKKLKARNKQQQAVSVAPVPHPATEAEVRLRVAGALLTSAPFIWAYWPTFVGLVTVWETQPDYSHGYLVIPLACLLAWSRWGERPPVSANWHWLGIGLLVLSLTMRFVGEYYFLNSLDGWSIILWVGGVVWLFFGWRMFWWSGPAIAFLIFMVPLPYRFETSLSYPLQRIATKISVYSLQMLGQPALAEGNTILLNELRLEVEQACSGLRIFVGVIALAFAYIVAFRHTWWERALILLSVVPIALLVNAGRIVVTGLLLQQFTGDDARHWAHDVSGWMMIPAAAILFGLLLWYFRLLFPPVRQVDVKSIIGQQW